MSLSLTVETLAAAIEEAGNWSLPHELAERLLPFIERHIAAGQPPTPAELAAEYCRGRDDGWEAAEQKYRQPPNPAGACRAVDDGVHSWSDPAVHGKVECLFCGDVLPKPAGAVPLPEPQGPGPVVDRTGDGWEVFAHNGCGYTEDDLIAYGDAREAAGRASVAAPDTGVVEALALRVNNLLTDYEPEDALIERDRIVSLIRSLPCVPPAPIPQQPAADDDHVLVERGLLGAACSAIEKKRDAPKVLEALRKITMTPAPEGAGGEAVGAQIVGWVHEDQLPDGYPYDAMFAHSKVDGVRMFPVFAPTPAADAGGVTLAMIRRGVDAWYASTFTGGGGLHLRIAEVLTAAITPEVRHGE